MKIVLAGRGEEVARRIVYTAWKACGGTFGSGWLQDRGEQTEDQVWATAYHREDYPGGRALARTPDGEVHCDYVQGRMMKFGLKFDADSVEIKYTDFPPESDYQAWSARYPTWEALADAALASLAADGRKG